MCKWYVCIDRTNGKGGVNTVHDGFHTEKETLEILERTDKSLIEFSAVRTAQVTKNARLLCKIPVYCEDDRTIIGAEYIIYSGKSAAKYTDFKSAFSALKESPLY